MHAFLPFSVAVTSKASYHFTNKSLLFDSTPSVMQFKVTTLLTSYLIFSRRAARHLPSQLVFEISTFTKHHRQSSFRWKRRRNWRYLQGLLHLMRHEFCRFCSKRDVLRLSLDFVGYSSYKRYGIHIKLQGWSITTTQ